jgi:GT2 family glycosyltransferase
MKVYEKDRDGVIGAVCATESTVPPPGAFNDKGPMYKMELRDRLKALNHLKSLDRIVDSFFPDPIFMENYSMIKDKKIPQWLGEEDAVLSGVMTGFRMSFRTDLIKKLKFDEALGKYSQYEDHDASLGIMENYFIIRANRAKVFHHRSPEKRVNGIEWGMQHILNKAYIVCKHNLPNALARRYLKRYSYYKLARYLMQAHTKYGRKRVAGAWRALSRIDILLNTPKEELAHQYIKLRGECLAMKSSRIKKI